MHLWGSSHALIRLPADYCGLGIESITDRSFQKKTAMLQSAIHLGGPHSLAAAGLLHRVPASQGTFLVPGWQ